jgi:hypothetical protein
MYIRQIEMRNLFSFNEVKNNNDITNGHKQKINSISFSSEVSLIVGPNNSAKSNIFRILKTVVNTLESPTKGLDMSTLFSSNTNPQLNVKITLSREEANIIIDFVSLFVEYRRAHDSYPLEDRIILPSLLDQISLSLSWSGVNMYPRKVVRTNDISIEFEKLDLVIVQSVETSALNITFGGRNYFPSSYFIRLLGTSKSAEQFKKKFKGHTRELEDPSNKLI